MNALLLRLLIPLTLIVLGAVLIWQGIQAVTAPSTTIYFLIFPIATVGPSFVQYAMGSLVLLAGIAFAAVGGYFGLKGV